MIPARQPHPQRCYNKCGHFDMHDHPKTVYCCLTGPGMIMKNEDILLVMDIGCASYQATHTSAPAPEPDEYIISFDHLMAIKETAYPLTIEERKRICDASRPVLETPITELSAINTALLKLYPDDFALQLNAKQLIQIRKEHDAQVAKAEREQIIKELESWNPFQRTFGNVLEALRQPEPQQEGRQR